jgi:hypothetical protein
MFPVRVAAPHGGVHERATPRSGGGVPAAHSTACGGSAPRHRLRCPARVSLAVPPGTGSAAWPHTPLEMPSTPRDAVPCLLPVHPLRAYQSLSYTVLLLRPHPASDVREATNRGKEEQVVYLQPAGNFVA